MCQVTHLDNESMINTSHYDIAQQTESPSLICTYRLDIGSSDCSYTVNTGNHFKKEIGN